jgi:hypothetical protein
MGDVFETIEESFLNYSPFSCHSLCPYTFFQGRTGVFKGHLSKQ